MVGPPGFEPGTSAMWMQRSTTELWALVRFTIHPYNSYVQRLIDDLKIATANFLEAFAISAVLVVLVFWFIGQPLEITGESMLPTFKDGEHTVANKLIYKFKEPEAGEIVILSHPETKGIYVIKRIIAIPGDTLEISDGMVYLNEKPLKEPYLAENTYTNGRNAIEDNEIITLKENEYIVLGDNRENSFDSRNWGIISKDEIVGMSSIVYYPLTNLRIVQQHWSFSYYRFFELLLFLQFQKSLKILCNLYPFEHFFLE